MIPIRILCAVFVACALDVTLAQETNRDAVALLASDHPRTLSDKTLLERAKGLSDNEEDKLRAQLETDPGDIETRMVLIFRELPDLRRQRGKRSDPKPHGKLVLGLIEQHPRSPLAGTAGLMLYPYKRDGMYTGPAWNEAIELWERLAAKNPKDPAIASNAGLFLIADPFLLSRGGARALVLLQRARKLAPSEPRWALNLGSYHAMGRAVTRDPEERAAHAKAGLPHLRAAWDLSDPSKRGDLDVMNEPLPMTLADAYHDVGDAQSARTFATLALDSEDPKEPRGGVVYGMNALLGRIALAQGDVDGAVRFLQKAGKTPGSPSLGSFGPDLTLAKELLSSGKRAAVLEFLTSCKVFWHSGQDRLTSMILSIKGGGDPWND
ncbi:MAG: tetratricopeptide (TPR) repeat protein [Planctomycetota bacterium]|jgi:tetratricopeptide (TPR) repeat protein